MTQNKTHSLTELLNQLAAPFPDSAIEWRKGLESADKKSAQALPVLTKTTVQARLDEVLGAENWTTAVSTVVQSGDVAILSCSVSLRVAGEWISKEDCAPVSLKSAESKDIKVGLAEAFKRAAAMWGVGRYLYQHEIEYVSVAGSQFVATPRLNLRGQAQASDQSAPGIDQASQSLKAESAPAPASPAPAVASAQAPVSTPAPEPAPAVQQPAAQQDQARGSTTDLDDNSRDFNRQSSLVDSLISETELAAQAAPEETEPVGSQPSKETVAQTQTAPAKEAEAATGIEQFTGDEGALVADLLKRVKNNVPILVIRSYVQGPRANGRLSDKARQFVLDELTRIESAN